MGDGGQPRDWGGNLAGAEGGRVHGGGELRRQRPSRASLQGRDRHPGVQVGRGRLRRLPGRREAGRGRGRPGHVLVNNAGITRDGFFHRMTKEQWSAVIRTNLDSLFNMTRPVIEGMRARAWGRVIVISSINGQKGQMGQVNYSAAKAGDIGFVKALAQESAAKGITVNAICPGYIGTEMVQAIDPEVLKAKILPLIPVGRLGQPEEIARAVAFLAGEEGGFITGSTLSINGGQYMM